MSVCIRNQIGERPCLSYVTVLLLRRRTKRPCPALLLRAPNRLGGSLKPSSPPPALARLDPYSLEKLPLLAPRHSLTHVQSLQSQAVVRLCSCGCSSTSSGNWTAFSELNMPVLDLFVQGTLMWGACELNGQNSNSPFRPIPSHPSPILSTQRLAASLCSSTIPPHHRSLARWRTRSTWAAKRRRYDVMGARNGHPLSVTNVPIIINVESTEQAA
ncbi:unnamed protein product [Periconia digitata]|uniref:Uncharacterized protein n=1 Tax=Periconia digitata TaxID=1303443 RepID=A0A9W4XPN8_9PLEO|nr:unnamed protein product [Periconia digitata]